MLALVAPTSGLIAQACRSFHVELVASNHCPVERSCTATWTEATAVSSVAVPANLAGAPGTTAPSAGWVSVTSGGGHAPLLARDGSNTSTRSLLASATYRRPAESAAMPDGLLNWCAPVPRPPHFPRNVPS